VQVPCKKKRIAKEVENGKGGLSFVSALGCRQMLWG